MKKKVYEKYLREFINYNGTRESIRATIQDRHWRIWSAILEIKSIIEDCRSQAIGGLAVWVELWELTVIPMILNNSGTWTNISEEIIGQLNNYQNKMLQYLFSTPRTTPSIVLWWDAGMLPVQHRIKSRKLTLAHHLANLPTSSLGRQVYDEQVRYGYPGLGAEVKQLEDELEIPRIKGNKHSKIRWKNLVKKAVK